jgi:four helix bundle protein
MRESFAMPERPEIRNYRDLSVWQLGMDIAVRVYEATRDFPSDEKFGLTSQLRRAAASVPANIAEGHARSTTKDYLRYVSIAIGSLAETATFIELAGRLGFGDVDELRKI